MSGNHAFHAVVGVTGAALKSSMKTKLGEGVHSVAMEAVGEKLPAPFKALLESPIGEMGLGVLFGFGAEMYGMPEASAAGALMFADGLKRFRAVAKDKGVTALLDAVRNTAIAPELLSELVKSTTDCAHMAGSDSSLTVAVPKQQQSGKGGSGKGFTAVMGNAPAGNSAKQSGSDATTPTPDKATVVSKPESVYKPTKAAELKAKDGKFECPACGNGRKKDSFKPWKKEEVHGEYNGVLVCAPCMQEFDKDYKAHMAAAAKAKREQELRDRYAELETLIEEKTNAAFATSAKSINLKKTAPDGEAPDADVWDEDAYNLLVTKADKLADEADKLTKERSNIAKELGIIEMPEPGAAPVEPTGDDATPGKDSVTSKLQTVGK